VLLVTGAYRPEISSGGLQCESAARSLRGTVAFLVLTTATDRSLPARETVDGVPVSRVSIDVRRRWSRARAAVRMLAALLRIVPHVDLVHLHGCSGKNVLVTAVAKLFRRRIVVTLHTAGFDEPLVVARQGRLASWAFSSADLYLSVSPGLVDAYLAAGLDAAKIRLVPNGVDVQRFSPIAAADRAALRRRLGFPADRPAILFVGFFSREKQPQVLLYAWLRMQRDPSLAATLVCVGATRSQYFEVDHELATTMRADAERRGVGDRLMLVDPTHEVQDYYRAADLFALPSAREGLPLVLLEAMATGLPCIASRLPGSTDVVVDDGVSGRLVPPGDVDALADAMTAVLRDPDQAALMGAAARARVCRDYDAAHMAIRWLEAYQLVMR
jgi:glycosyltransferase involved in cell wall biosynthesis